MIFVGIDVGKFDCMAAAHGRAGRMVFAPTAEGTAGFLSRVRALGGEVRAGLEATGGYEAALWEALVRAGVAVCQLSPARVHAFARSRGCLAKTDGYDAATIAAFLADQPEVGRLLPAENMRHIRALTTKRRQLVEMRATLSCQMKPARDPDVARLDADHLAFLDRQIAGLEPRLHHLIATDADLMERRDLLRSIPGIGPLACTTLLAEMPELGHLPPKAPATLSCQMKPARDPDVARLDADHLAFLDRQIAGLEPRLHHLIATDADLMERRDLLRSIPGIGPLACTTLLAEMPELGHLPPKAPAALACQMKPARDPDVARLDADHLAFLDRQIAGLEPRLHHLIATDADLMERRDLLRSIPGIGPLACTTLLAEMPELGHLPPKAPAALACQMKPARDPDVARLDADHLAFLDRQIAGLEPRLHHLIATDADLMERRDLLRSIPGIGPLACTTLLAEMPELGHLPPKAPATLAGLAPLARDSGTKTGKRFTRVVEAPCGAPST